MARKQVACTAESAALAQLRRPKRRCGAASARRVARIEPRRKSGPASPDVACAPSGMPETSPLQCLQVFDEVGLLGVAPPETEQPVVVIDHGEQIGSAAVVEVWRMLPERSEEHTSELQS